MFLRSNSTCFVRGPVLFGASIITLMLFHGATAAFAQANETTLHYAYNSSSGAVVECQVFEVTRQTTGLTDHPLVVIEGLDLSNQDFGDFGRDQFERAFRSPAARGGPDLWELMLDAGYDFYLVDFKTFDYTIEDMAALLRMALFQAPGNVWESRTTQSQPFIVLGASTGGLIGRLALSQAEQMGVNHHTRLFGSLDSPHRGAIIPLDLQAFTYFWSAYGSGAAEQVEQLHWRSVKQMLIRRQEGRGGVGAPPPTFPTTDFDRFQEMYRSALPHNTRTIALSNGSATGEEQRPDNYGQVQFLFDFDPFGPGEFHSVLTSLNKFGGSIRYSFNSYEVAIIGESIGMTSAVFNNENAPGGYRLSYKKAADSLKAAFEGSFSGVPTPVILGDGRHCFIPLASALDLNVDIKTRDGVFSVPAATATSPFDYFYTAAANTEHVDLNAYYGPLLYEIGIEYPRTIYVDRNFAGEELGTQSNPFKTVAKANSFAWNGVEINIRAGSYPETVTFSKRVTVVASGGTVTLGDLH